MRRNPFEVSLDTLIAASPLLGHELEDRTAIRDGHEPGLARRFQFGSATPLRGASQRDLFCVAPLDLLVSQVDGRRHFHLLELNGTGIGGVTNLPDDVVGDVLDSLADSAGRIDDPDGVVLVAVSGKESQSCPRRNRLMHEKLLFVEALRRGLARRYGAADAANLDSLGRLPRRGGRPAVVLGYIKDLVRALARDADGTLWLEGRRVTAAVNDRFCRNVLDRFDDQVDLERWQTLNRCFAAGSDKGLAYALMNDFLQDDPRACLPRRLRHAHAESRSMLIALVLEWLADGRQVVIKPHGTGLGHGIEFFLDPAEPVEQIIARIDASLAQTAEFYDVPGGALPYTLCEYVDADRLRAPGHRLDGHKFELRVVVYRQGASLRACPSIVKIARERADEGGSVRRALINNITASGDTDKVCGSDYMLPLCNHRTLRMLGLSVEQLEELCGALTAYVRYVLDQVEDRPQRFGLPQPVAAPRRAAAVRAPVAVQAPAAAWVAPELVAA